MNICPYLIIQMYKISLKRDEYGNKSNNIFGMYMLFIYIWKSVYSSNQKILKLIFNSILGGITILLINLIGGMWGFHIGLNFFTSILVGILGLPGAVCLVIIKLLI